MAKIEQNGDDIKITVKQGEYKQWRFTFPYTTTSFSYALKAFDKAGDAVTIPTDTIVFSQISSTQWWLTIDFTSEYLSRNTYDIEIWETDASSNPAIIIKGKMKVEG